MLRNWLIVYIANFIDSIFIAYMMNKSGKFPQAVWVSAIKPRSI